MDERFEKFLARDFEWIRKQMEEMMGRPMLASLAGGCAEPGCFQPAMDVFETPHQVIVRIDLPGIDREKVSVVLEGGILTISGRRRERLPDDPGEIRRHQMEIDYGFFARKVHINLPMKEDSTRAIYRDGMLEIQIQKAPIPASHTVAVRGGSEEEQGR